jgi:hypothetical protein
MPADIASERARRLLDAHVAFELAELQGPRFAELVEREVDHALDVAARLTLGQVVRREDVVAVATKYVAQFALPGAIPEIVGDLAGRIRAHEANDVTLGELVPRAHVSALITKIAAMRPVREWIAVQITESPAVQTWLADYLRSLTAGAVENNVRLAKKVPGVSLGLSLGNRIAGGAVREADQRTREMTEQAAIAILTRSRANILAKTRDEDVEAALVDLWDRAAPREIGDLLATVDDDDLVDVASILYDAWLDLRDHAYLLAMVETGIDHVFDRYGEMPLDELLAEFGLGRDDLVQEALRFAPPAIDALAAEGVLDDLLRRQFARFYDSEQAQAVLRD